MASEVHNDGQERWEGEFSPAVYSHARALLDDDEQRVLSELRGETARRARILIVAAIVWAACSVALAFVDGNLLLVSEVGWVAIAAWAVFYLYPTIVGRGNAGDVYDLYREQLGKLESAGIAMPDPASMEELVAAIDLVSPAE